MKDFILSSGLFIAKLFLVPVIAKIKLRKFKLYEVFTLEGIGKALNVNKKPALKIYRRSVKRLSNLGIEFFFTSRLSQPALQKKIDAVNIKGAEQLMTTLALSRPILIVTIYMGNFPLGFLRLMSSVKNQRKVFAFKVNAKNSNEDILFSLFRKTSQDIQPLRANEDGGKKAFLALRQGNVVAMMVDAEVHVRSRKEVTFFNQQCLMQSGPATLATLTNAIIVPIINYEDTNSQPVVQVETPLYSDKIAANESHQEVIARLTQGIAKLIENWIRIDPSQVQRWPSIAQILSHSVSENQ